MPKEKKLTYRKCERCRKDRQKCTPTDRMWPGRRCDRCRRYGYACSANKSKDQERDGTNENTTDRLPLLRSSTSGDLKQMTDMQCVQEFDDIRALEVGYEIIHDCQDPWGLLPREEKKESRWQFEHWVHLRACDILDEIQRRASQHEADGLYKDAEFLYRRIFAEFKIRIEDVDDPSVRKNLHKLVQVQKNMGDFSTAERTQEYLLTEACGRSIGEEPGVQEELAEEFAGLLSLFIERMTGRDKHVTLFAKVSALHRAVVLDLDALNRLLLQRQFFEVEFRNVGTPLHLAADEDAVNLGRLLISGGADVDHQDWFGTTPLVAAASRRHARMVRLLLENKAKVDMYDNEGDTALHTACDRYPGLTSYPTELLDEDQKLKTVRILLEGGANINAKNTLAWTALLTAIDNGHERLASYLLDMGACIEVRNDQQKQESQIASFRRKGEPMHLLPFPLEIYPKKQVKAKSILHLAIEQGQPSVVRKLIDRGVDVNTIDVSCRTALEYAQEFCDKEVVQMLVEAGAVDLRLDSDDLQSDESTPDAPIVDLTAASSSDGSNTTLTDP